jgi:hypothetical protein
MGAITIRFFRDSDLKLNGENRPVVVIGYS